jgi:hypothetical protein
VHKNLIYVSDAEMQALAETASVGQFGLEHLVGTAAWVMAHHDQSLRDSCVRAFMYQNSAARPATPARRKTVKEKLHGLARRIHSFFL